MAFGLELNTVTGDFTEVSDALYKGVNAWMESFIFYFLYPSYWKLLPSPTHKHFQHDLTKLAEVERQLFRESQQQERTEDTFLHKLSAMIHDESGRNATEEEVLQDIREMLAGGSDTSANTLTYALYFMSQNPDVEEKAVKEVLDGFDESRPKSAQDLPYIKAVLSEAMR